jgi:hypothetical protein
MRIRISFQDLLQDSTPEPAPFPKYTSQIINLANQNAQGTRPKVVGQLSTLIEEFPGKTFEEWVAWYTAGHPTALGEATDRICAMLENLRRALDQIDRSLVQRWVTDLVLRKTFFGLRFQQAILRRLATKRGVPFRIATTEEESRGIDGFLGEMAVSVKPHTYRSKPMLSEEISAKLVFYTKEDNGLIVEYDF